MGETFGGELGGVAVGGGGCCGLACSSDPGGGRGGPLKLVKSYLKKVM